MKPLIIVSGSALAIAAVLTADLTAPSTSALTLETSARASTIPAPGKKGIVRTISHLESELGELEQKKLPPMRKKEAAAKWKEIESWISCAEAASCDLVNETDPRSRHFAIREKILEVGSWFLAHTPENPDQVRRSYQAATRLISFPEEQVQGLALQWIYQLPPDPASISLLREHLGDMVDPELAQLTLLELKRHLNTEYEGAALDLVESLLFEGGIFASREVARSAPILLHEGNQERFHRWIDTLPPTSAKVKLLRESVDTAKRTKGGV